MSGERLLVGTLNRKSVVYLRLGQVVGDGEGGRGLKSKAEI